MILVIVYVGAVAVLFLFVVMMLDIDFTQLRRGVVQYLPIGATIGVILLVELALIFGAWVFAPQIGQSLAAPMPLHVTNTAALGDLLYTKYAYAFQASGLILLIAMIGAIVLTLRSRGDVRRQNIGVQVSRRRDETLELIKVKSRQGADKELGVR
jgi:NADH-quinone oxidoreductase subunit J